ncbi:solute carrier family 35 member B1 isoform X2 [Hydra vulgaris]|uniref:Solute carrier family 35 member B1 isoform X2 n=1 Tax=Hydra vulgaris TaxID=6087 RepID=A0ABM4CY54_HYDVU
MVIQKEVILDIPTINRENKYKTAYFSNFKMNENQKLIFCCFGVFFCYFYYGVLQERITRVPYGDAGEKFSFQLTLVFFQCIVNSAFAYAVLKTTYKKESQRDDTSILLYILCSVSYMGAMLSSNMSLKYVNYPTQVLGKSCKPIPVMLLGVLLARKKYSLMKYACVIFIVLGVALFMYKDKKSSSAQESVTGYGEILLIISLALDGMTGVFQERMRRDYKSQPHTMMYGVNKWSTVILAIGMIWSGEFFGFLGFVGRYPEVLWNMMLFSIASALGQNFIFTTVSHYGPLTCSVITTTRKFFTILFSILFFGNPITSRQIVAVFLVFTGLTLDTIYGK